MKEKRAFVMIHGKRGRSGFTLVELLTVLAIISMLVGLLVPSLAAVRRAAKEALQRSRLNAIEAGLLTFRNDNGDYPPSNWTPVPNRGNYCGAQKLAEALLGWDLVGFHPESAWSADGLDINGGPWTYDPLKTRDNNGDGIWDTLVERKGRYLDLEAANAFELGALFPAPGVTGTLARNTFVICDVFAMTRVTIGGETKPAGAPILYYRANTGSKTIDPSAGYAKCIYNADDNARIVTTKEDADRVKNPSVQHPLDDYAFFYGTYIVDLRASRPGLAWPYRPDSFLLISAGADGLYGSDDDICNFGN